MKNDGKSGNVRFFSSLCGLCALGGEISPLGGSIGCSASRQDGINRPHLGEPVFARDNERPGDC